MFKNSNVGRRLCISLNLKTVDRCLANDVGELVSSKYCRDLNVVGQSIFSGESAISSCDLLHIRIEALVAVV